jgi:hypothetical protein
MPKICHAFAVTESWWFKRMIRAGGVTDQIPGGDTAKNKIKNRMKDVEQDIDQSLAITASTVAVSLDGWTSQNSFPMIAVNATWLDDHFKQHQACIEFIEIDSSHSGENLASIVYSTLKKFNICQKLLTITSLLCFGFPMRLALRPDQRRTRDGPERRPITGSSLCKVGRGIAELELQFLF